MANETGEAYWQHFAHQADIGVRGVAPSRAAAFAEAALALTAVLVAPAQVAPREAVAITCRASDDALLLADWLNALIFEMATRRMLFGRFEVDIAEQGAELRLTATAWGEAVDVARHQPAVEVKGATYTELKVVRRPDGSWLAQCVVDV